MKKITFLFLISLLTISFTSCSNDEESNISSNDSDQFLTTNTLKIDDKEYDLVEGTNYWYGYSEEYNAYTFVLWLNTIGPGDGVDFEWEDYATLNFQIYSETEDLGTRSYESSSFLDISEGNLVNKFSRGSFITTGFNDENYFLSNGTLTVSQSIDNNYFEIDYVSDRDDSTIIIHYEGEFEVNDFSQGL